MTKQKGSGNFFYANGKYLLVNRPLKRQGSWRSLLTKLEQVIAHKTSPTYQLFFFVPSSWKNRFVQAIQMVNAFETD